MKTIALFTLILCSNLIAQDTPVVFHPSMSFTNLALLPNPALARTAASTKDIRSTMNGISIADQDLRRALRELLSLIEDQKLSLRTNVGGLASGTTRIRVAAARVTGLYQSYQKRSGRDTLKAELKYVAEQALLAALKRIEWVVLRDDASRDEHFHSYYSVLLHYRTVEESWLLKNGTFVRVPVEQKRL